jgi:hypothetical protein
MRMPDASALSARSGFVEHRGARLLVVDASDLRAAADIQALIAHTEALIRGEPAGSVRIAMIVRGFSFDRRSAAAIKGVFARVQPWIRASSLVGVAGLQRVLLQVLNQVARRERGLFDTLDAAKDWLAGQG